MRKVKLIEVKSELGAGTRGASLGVEALKIACLNSHSTYFKRFNAVEVPHLNHVLFDKNLFPFAKYIDSILTVHKNISAVVTQTVELGMFPLVLAGDHSNSAAAIAGIKCAYPDKTLGLIWIDAHADCHSPYTSPSGNVHGMPVAMVLNEDNLKCARNPLDPETRFYWEAAKRVGRGGPKIKHRHVVYIVVRDTEGAEDILMKDHGIKNFNYHEFNQKGAEQVAREALQRLGDCDLIYVSFDVDSLDSKFSKGTGTPVEIGLTVEQAKELCYHLLRNDKVCCFDLVEINPTLDTQNTMAQNAFEILEAATEAILER